MANELENRGTSHVAHVDEAISAQHFIDIPILLFPFCVDTFGHMVSMLVIAFLICLLHFISVPQKA